MELTSLGIVLVPDEHVFEVQTVPALMIVQIVVLKAVAVGQLDCP